ncbi:MAG TPA: NRDE family protein [Steroidobacteraceae bacterium]
MCLILLAWRAHPHYPLVLAANRDEFHDRAAASACWWRQPQILAGRDLQGDGTWLGVARSGRFAALTNYRDPALPQAAAPSRGELVPATLASSATSERWLAQLARIAGRYNPFNLIFSDGEQLAVYESVAGAGRLLGPGVYALSNHLLDTPWPKVRAAKSALAAALTRLPDDAALLTLLRDERQAADGQLPRTGMSLEWERLLSSAFIRASTYGTRCSTILLQDRHGAARFSEWTWAASGELAGQIEHRFDLGAVIGA